MPCETWMHILPSTWVFISNIFQMDRPRILKTASAFVVICKQRVLTSVREGHHLSNEPLSIHDGPGHPYAVGIGPSWHHCYIFHALLSPDKHIYVYQPAHFNGNATWSSNSRNLYMVSDDPIATLSLTSPTILWPRAWHLPTLIHSSSLANPWLLCFMLMIFLSVQDQTPRLNTSSPVFKQLALVFAMKELQKLSLVLTSCAPAPHVTPESLPSKLALLSISSKHWPL